MGKEVSKVRREVKKKTSLGGERGARKSSQVPAKDEAGKETRYPVSKTAIVEGAASESDWRLGDG